MSDVVSELKKIAQSVVSMAKRHGADDAEAIIRDGTELTAKVRLGEAEMVREAGSRALGLRVFKDRRRAVTYTSDMRPASLEALVRESVSLAELSEPDELNELPDPALLAVDVPDLELYDPSCESLSAADALASAKAAEKAAMDADERVTNSDGATFSRNLGSVVFATSGGFVGGYRGSYVSLYAEPICDDEDGKKRNGYWWTAGRFMDELDDAEAVGLEAARRTVAQLGARKVDTTEVPVVFEPEAGRAIVGMVFSVANGSSFYRKSSYLLEREGTAIASDLVSITDDPLIPRASGSRPFDGDGLPTRVNSIVKDGVLETVLCDTYSARKLGRESTGSAGRGVGGNPSPTTSNLILTPGEMSKDELIGSIDKGLYVTSMMGFGFNPVTGDFSRGAAGFWIENGAIAFPVTEVTISANFDDLLKRIDAIASDIDRRSSTQCSTFRVSHMMVAGK